MDSTDSPETPKGTDGGKPWGEMTKEELVDEVVRLTGELHAARAAREMAEVRTEFATQELARVLRGARAARDTLNALDLGGRVPRLGDGSLLGGLKPMQDPALPPVKSERNFDWGQPEDTARPYLKSMPLNRSHFERTTERLPFDIIPADPEQAIAHRPSPSQTGGDGTGASGTKPGREGDA